MHLRLHSMTALPRPSGARQAAAAAVMSEDEAMHAYQLHAFGLSLRAFIALTPRLPPDAVDYLPIPGIKPILGLVLAVVVMWAGLVVV